ncbi:SRPBCC family protein [Pedobacter aquatilis]|uniref:SRPBCC family protein n=1 Tax=Pedobacter aquatilis TaxID=351343 RepID=UPI0025B5A7A2|nr:SRPBCC family protein [Pedobacter aquatilis]MDN3587928.1 SRPBCC family protein [Pedobacter aquatilis]
MATSIISSIPETEIVSSRTVNYPINLVFEAFSDPNHLKNWWGPTGFTNTFNEFDFREGGKWSFVMHGPDKGNYPNECKFIKIDAPNLIAWKRFSKPLFQVLFTFETAENNTKIVFKMLFDTAKECDKLRPIVEDKNEENFDKLEKVLESLAD